MTLDFNKKTLLKISMAEIKSLLYWLITKIYTNISLVYTKVENIKSEIYYWT